MALDDITTRIISEAKDAAEELLAEAKAEVDQIKKQAEKRLTESKKVSKQKAELEAHSIEKRMVASAELDARKSLLTAKQSAITSAIDRAVENLRSMNETEYIDFVAAVLSEAPIESETEIVAAKRDREILERNLPKLQKHLESAGKKFHLTLAADTREIGGGVVLRTGKIEYNASLPAIRRGMEEELRSVAASILFPTTGSG